MDFNDLVGYNVLGMVDDQYVIELSLESHHMNQFGFVHGGVLFTMLDAAMSRACFNALSEERKAGVTLEMKINYLKSVWEGSLTVYGKLVNLTRRTAYVEGHILNEEGELVAKATGSMYLPDPR